MSYSAVIRLWRLVDADVLRNIDALPAGTQLLQRGAMKLGPPVQNPDPVPVLINHDPDRVIGFVRSLSNFPEVRGEWLVAHTTITDAPDWLGKDTPASICTKVLERTTYGPLERVLSGWVDEVSVLSPGRRPKEPRARVILYDEIPADDLVRQSGDVVFGHGEMIYGGGTIRRYFPNAVVGIS